MNGGALAALAAAAPSLARSLPALERGAASEAPILVLGAPGTGRTALARALHAASGRAAGPLVELDPATIPATLFESELFGHRPGAFTGADRAYPGRVERARGGSLLVDPVEELPLEAQPKLLHLLSERRFAPLGGAETEADLRWIAVGPDDLGERVARGAFREDLFYRIEVLTFRLPRLAERREDVGPLLDSLLADLAVRFGRPAARLTDGARAWMLDHPWPGNVRQLRNVLERALLAADGDRLDPAPPAEAARAAGAIPRSLAESERETIRAALAATRGHQGRAAALLGISRKGLWEKRRRLGVP
jgi:DNA-binding NtrC family response regulator